MSKSRRGRGGPIGRGKSRKRWLPWGLAGAVAVLVLLVVVQGILSRSPGGRGPRDFEWFEDVRGTSYDAGETEFEYPNPAGLTGGRQWLPALGREDAPVVVMEFNDIFCSHCRDFSLDNLSGFLEDYVATGDVRWVAHFYGFAPAVERGAVQAQVCAAEQGRYFEYEHALFQSIELGDFNIDRAARLAALDLNQFDQCRAEQRYVEAVQEMLFVDNNGVSATPTFFVNGQEVAGNDPARLRALIDAELAAD